MIGSVEDARSLQGTGDAEMNALTRRVCGGRGFSMVEVLVTIAIISLLIALFVPAVGKINEVASRVRQKAQFGNIERALEAYNTDHNAYPVSFSFDAGASCHGAQILGEAIMGLDGLGLHPDSIFSPDRQDGAGVDLYYPEISVLTQPEQDANLQNRIGPYLENDAANATRFGNIYGPALQPDTMVLADMFTKEMRTGLKAGMPILYYRANTANSGHDPADWGNSVYNFGHNTTILNLGTPWSSAAGSHTMDPSNSVLFYRNTQDPRFTAKAQPYRSQSFILISAGKDGDYGTADDVYNFDRVEQ